MSDMKIVGWGWMIVIVLIVGFKGYFYVFGYCVVKYGVVGFIWLLVVEFVCMGIMVNVICFGFLDMLMLVCLIDNIVVKIGMDLENVVGVFCEINF